MFTSLLSMGGDGEGGGGDRWGDGQVGGVGRGIERERHQGFIGLAASPTQVFYIYIQSEFFQATGGTRGGHTRTGNSF